MDNQVILKIFPGAEIGNRGMQTIEINNLKADTKPQDCNVICTKVEDDRTYYFIESHGFGIYLRVCKAYPGSPYAEFAVIHYFKDTADYDYHDWRLKQRMKF